MGFDYRTSQDWGNRLLEGTNQTLCAWGARRKKVSPLETVRLACECLGVSSGSTVWLQARQQGGDTTLLINRKLEDLLRTAPPIRTISSFSHSQSLLLGSFHKPLYPYSSEGRQNVNHSHRKLTNLITRTTALSNSMKL